MARDLTASVITEITSTSLRPFLLFEGEFANGYVRVWTGYGNLTWNSYTWTGVGDFAAVSAVEETTETRAAGVTVSLSGIPSAMISTTLSSARQGKTGKLYIGVLDASGAVIADPYLAFQGRLDVPAIDDGGETATISISYESRLVDLERPRERRYTPEDLQIDYADDRGFEYVAALQDVSISWGRS